MRTQLSLKLASFAMAMLINTLMVSSVAYLFNGQMHPEFRAAANQLQNPSSIPQTRVIPTVVLG